MSTGIIVSNQNNVSNTSKTLVSIPVTYSGIETSALYRKPVTIREMVIRRINKTLCVFLLFTISAAFISYYIAMNYEAKLNLLDREIVNINTENMDLQADLDRYKSFNNVDSKIGEFKLLQKADKVMEMTALSSSDIISDDKKNNETTFNWAIGY